jgi:myo-inositol-1(or 4)-monophosphatase
MRMNAEAAGEGYNRLHEDFELLQIAVREAGAVALGYFGTEVASKQKPDGTRVSEADLAANDLLRAALVGNRPSYGWLSEESADDPARLGCRFTWIVDPIDGTHAFLSRVPEWTIAAALVDNGRPVLSAVFNPVTSEMFTARRGHGTRLNGAQIFVRDRSQVEGAKMIGSAGQFKKKIWSEPWPEMNVRWVHSIAYRMARVAQGRAHATISMTAKHEWDLAAPALLVQEAGGRATGIDGGALTFNQPVPRLRGLVAAGQELHGLLVERTKLVVDIG